LGNGDGQFGLPNGLVIHDDGNVFVSDLANERVLKFTANGEYLGKLGGDGSEPGQVSGPAGIGIGRDGQIYVVEQRNSRIQAFKQVTMESNNRAIIVSGGGDYPGNHLWDATQICANFAYRALNYQGFNKERIHYLSSDTGLDIDGNGVADDVDGKATSANLQTAITGWASGADNVLIYLTDHGGDSTFRMSEQEMLPVADLAAWLNTLEQSITGKVIII